MTDGFGLYPTRFNVFRIAGREFIRGYIRGCYRSNVNRVLRGSWPRMF